MDQGRFAPTERGSPQGGVISPMLMNVALHGMEEAAEVRHIRTGSNAGTARGAHRLCSDTPMTFWHCVTHVHRPNRSRRGWPRG